MAGAGALHLCILVMAALTLFPFLWMAATSIKPPEEIFRPGLHLVPSTVTWANYVTAVQKVPLSRFLLNGVIVAGGVLVLQLLTVIPAAFAFARLEFRGRGLLFGLVLAALVVPGYVTSVPNFLLLSDLRLTNTYWALILPFVGSAFGIFLMRQFFRQIPGEILDAALIDGCGTGRLLWHVLLPLVRPAIAAFSVFSVVTHWNDFFWPLIAIQSAHLYTPPAGIAYFADADGGANWGAVMAATVIIVSPLLVMFIMARRQFIESLAHISVKG
ncbi:MAG: carbohydrate ABC transporter permease [Armatimonadota bacterium]|nr:carbohydrate ABC transporter permease [Armatimonadota bacterium]